MAANPAHQPNPGLIFDTLNAYQRTMALKGAIDLDLFTQIGDSAASAATIATRLGASERGVRMLCDFLTIMGFLIKRDGAYALTPDAAMFLNKQSPAYMGGMANFLTHESLIPHFSDVAAMVRKGGSVSPDVAAEPENPIWVEFARSMAGMAAMTARTLAPLVSEPGKPMKVLDIAASHGRFGISIALHNPAAEIVAADWGNVLQVALENARQAGVADRYRTIPGSVFDVDLGSGYDLVLLPNFVHMFDPATIVKLLKKVRAAMKPGGCLATVEFVPNEDRITPPAAAAFSFNMLAATSGGDAYTFRELDEMLRQAGFGESKIQSLAPAPQQVVLTRA
jgi:2-polyprenyl-3-methyl-5-hydroxy-6-metoxy-1,4-benzoquinol methylase